MTLNEIKRKNLILINYLQEKYPDYFVKAEYSLNDDHKNVIVVQEQQGKKTVFYNNTISPINNYYMIDVYSASIAESKSTSVEIGNLIGENIIINTESEEDNIVYEEKWQIMFKQLSNPQTIMYEDIRRVGYTTTLQCIVNIIKKEIKTEEE